VALRCRGDLQRCLVVCPGSLAEQWQDELYRRFHLPFEILTNDKLEAARTGNWFLETNLVIARLDKLSRNEDVQQKLSAPDCRWDLIVCDEAHKMSATYFGGEVKFTKRYRLGQLLSGRSVKSGQAMLDALVVGEDDAEKLADGKHKRQEQPPNRKRSGRDPSRIARLTGVMPSPHYCPRKRNAGAPLSIPPPPVPSPAPAPAKIFP
jgi:hypothetical protein